MGVFDDILKSDESLFRDTLPLDFDFMPKIVHYRENEQREVAYVIKPLFEGRNGKNLFIYGPPGVGKTVLIKNVLRELEEKTDEIIPFYINCWQKNSSFKIFSHILTTLGYMFVHNKKSDELLTEIQRKLNKKNISAVFVFDEIDKAENLDFLYSLIENIYRKSIVLITNYKEYIHDIDERIKSRLLPSLLEFKPYNNKEIKGILEERKKYAFFDNVWEEDAFELVVEKTTDYKDVRLGLFLMKESGDIAESKASRKIKREHVEKAIEKISMFYKKEKSNLDNSSQEILDFINKNLKEDKIKIGNLYNKYKEINKEMSYKTFQRRIQKLKEGGFIDVNINIGGKEGTTSFISKNKIKSLKEFSN